MKNRTRRGPTEDKDLSLARDRRNTYGENDKASRKAIPRFKASSSREGRRGVQQALLASGASFDEADEVKLHQASRKATHPMKRKSPDTPLGEVVRAKAEARGKRAGGKSTRAKARERSRESK